MPEIHCRHFNGYKPCGFSIKCDRDCAHFDEVQKHVVIIHLGALGAVLRSTSLLAAIKRNYAKSLITWVTDKPSDQLLLNNPLIDRVLTTSADDLLKLRALRCALVLCIDKSLKAAGVAATLSYEELRGFRVDSITGAVLPANSEALELWSLGLSNEQKFFENVKTENQLVHEALNLGAYVRDPYEFYFDALELQSVRARRASWAAGEQVIIGLNTGCSGVLPYKKLTVEYQRRLVQRLQDVFAKDATLVLLGGPEDSARNAQIAQGMNVIASPTERGLRDGMVSVAACDLIISGDSLGLHMGIAQKKWCVAWFGPTCAQEIELYGRGVKILSSAPCSPCWKRVCDRTPMCYDLVDLQEIMDGVSKGIAWLKKHTNSSSKQPFPEISS